MRQSELKAILEDHILWLGSDGKQGKRASLQGADLEDANLHGAYLQYANLHGANLHGANLHGANLHGSDLQGADLVGVNLRAADLQGADLVGVSLDAANLEDAKFTTNFKKVGWFHGATFSEDQIPWVVLHPRYPKWADTLKWVEAKQLSA